MLPGIPGKAQLIFAVEWIGVFAAATAVSVSFVDQSSPTLRGFAFVLTSALLWWVIVRFDLLPPPENENDVISGQLGHFLGYTGTRPWYRRTPIIVLIIGIFVSATYKVTLEILFSWNESLVIKAISIIDPISKLLLHTVPAMQVAVQDLTTAGRSDEVILFVSAYTFNYLASFFLILYLFSFHFYGHVSGYFYTLNTSTIKSRDVQKHPLGHYGEFMTTISQKFLKHHYGQYFSIFGVLALILIIFIFSPLSVSRHDYIFVDGGLKGVLFEIILFYAGPIFLFIFIFSYISLLKYRQIVRRRPPAKIAPQTEE